ncbi:hypothetical protein POM88_042534 [Heracleum sosnowskyi]|uniref:Uncharacterized protein n=1 Tax=Heracleum sosnowskyi TaxID=360622 RepID=A0AAD8HIK7_9APIA|nr:hypothetical protein POM88_042534 [Heracleum sosnowskyi]
MDEKLFSDLEDQIIKSFSKKDHAVYNEHLERHKLNGDPSDDIFLSLPIVSTLIYGEAEFWILTSRHTPRIDVNAPIIDGMFPLHLAVMTSSSFLIHKLIGLYGAKLDVKCCGDPGSPFYGLTPLEMALKVLSRNFIPWTPQMSVPELLSMFHANNAKMKSLMFNITILACNTPRIRHLVMEYSLQGKVSELAALLNMASSYPIDFSRMNIPTSDIPLELHSGVPMNLRLLVATRSASLIKEGIHLSASLNPEEYDNCRIKLKEMDAVRTLLESAEKGDIYRFDVKQQLTGELSYGSLEGSQDESEVKTEVNTVAPQYLKNSFSYVDPSKFQPPGIFNSLMPLGYRDSLNNYDGLDIRNCNALAETIFRVLDGRKVEELNLEDTQRFQHRLENCLQKKFKEAEILTALEEKGPKPGGFFPLSKAFKQMDIKKISTSVFSAVKKGKALEAAPSDDQTRFLRLMKKSLSGKSYQLVGEIPEELGNLTELIDFLTGEVPNSTDTCSGGKLLYLCALDNMFSGGLPETFASCLSLLRLRISRNQLYGSIPEGILGLEMLRT